MKQQLRFNSKYLLYYVLSTLLACLVVGFFGFFPTDHYFLIDYNTSIDFPNFWDKYPFFYSILPFSTLICIFFKYVHSARCEYLILFIFLIYAYGIFNFSYKISKSREDFWYTLLLIFLSLPLLVGLFTGNIAVIFSILVFFLSINLINKNIFFSQIISVVMVCIKFNLMPLLLINNILYTRSFISIATLRIISFQILAFIILQVVSFILISDIYPEYSIHKILFSFQSYTQEYIRGPYGFDYRYWLGNMSRVIIDKLHLTKNISTIFIVVSYIYVLLGGLLVFVNERRIVRAFIFTVFLLYLNVSTTIYWYTMLLPFLAFFLQRANYLVAEILLASIFLYPKVIISVNYTSIDNTFVYFGVISYVTYKLFSVLKRNNKLNFVIEKVALNIEA